MMRGGAESGERRWDRLFAKLGSRSQWVWEQEENACVWARSRESFSVRLEDALLRDMSLFAVIGWPDGGRP
jgi:hypothetical protein